MKKHGHSRTRLYAVWSGMKSRCNNKNNAGYHLYGGRGISVCKEWESDYMCFYTWALKNGYFQGLTLDRIDVNGNYEPSNCRWVDIKTQNRNRRNNIKLEYNGNIEVLHDIAKSVGWSATGLKRRLDSGFTLEEALKTEKKQYLIGYRGRKVISIDKNGVKKEYPSLMQASKITRTPISNIIKVCKGERFTANGYKWVYADERQVM